MPSHNPSGPNKRRGASSRRSNQDNSDKSGKSGDRPFKKSSSGGFNKSAGKDSKGERSFGKRSGDGNFSKPSNFQRPYKKFDSKGSESGGSERGGNRPFSGDSKNQGPYKKPYSKRSDTGGGSERGARGSSTEGKRPFSGDSRNQRPYKKPYSKRPDTEGGSERGTGRSFTEGKRSFSGDSKDQSSFKKSYPKRSDTGGPGRKETDSFDSRKKSFSSNSTRGSYKKFDSDKSKDDVSKRSAGPSSRGHSKYNKTGSDFSSPSAGSRTSRSFDKPPRKDEGRKDANSLPQKQEDEGSAPGKIRLNKFIANSGVCSRREADQLITLGLITVNGVTISELGYKVNPGDEVRHEGKLLRAEKPVYILMNKPKGFLTTTADPQERNTVMHLISNVVKERVYPVGRLDRNTTGLLLLTNDGDLAEKLMHPSYNVKKIYKVDLDRPLTKADAQQIIDGVKLEEGRAIVDDLAIVSDDRKTIGLEIHIGWNRVVRRIFEALEYQVVKLDRSGYAGLTKKEIGRGEWRFLKNEELVLLKHFK